MEQHPQHITKQQDLPVPVFNISDDSTVSAITCSQPASPDNMTVISISESGEDSEDNDNKPPKYHNLTPLTPIVPPQHPWLVRIRQLETQNLSASF